MRAHQTNISDALHERQTTNRLPHQRSIKLLAAIQGAKLLEILRAQMRTKHFFKNDAVSLATRAEINFEIVPPLERHLCNFLRCTGIFGVMPNT